MSPNLQPTEAVSIHHDDQPSNLDQTSTLIEAIRHLLSQQGYPVDNIRLNDIVKQHSELPENKGQTIHQLSGIIAILQGIGIKDMPEILEQPDAAFLPLLAYRADIGWGIIDSQTPQKSWNFRQEHNHVHTPANQLSLILRIRLKDDPIKQRKVSFSELLKSDLGNYKGILFEAIIATFLINMLALAVSLFSMQVYDRVIPTRSEYTLIILASGVFIVIIFEAFMKFSRSRIMDKVVVGLDQYLSREVFQRLLKVRIDQMPGSVGSMAAQLRGYEQVRSFFTASTLFGLVDLPMTIIFISLVAFIGSPLVAVVPVIAAVIAILMGLSARKRIDAIAAEGATASYYKKGQVLLDGLDIHQISRETLSERLGYLQQDHRLFQGTLRENLLIGMAAPDDDVLQEALIKTGLINLVASHSSGLDLPISEGGRGLSGGQKQLVAFTRLLLTKPNVFLLDEPTASMDNRQEQRCLQVLKQALIDGQTFIVSTHKTALLELADRLIIMDNQRIIIDGPKQAVLDELRKNEQMKSQTSQSDNKPMKIKSMTTKTSINAQGK